MKQTLMGFLVFLLATFTFNYPLYASHFASAELQAQYIGTGPTDMKYRLTLIIYKVCEPNNAFLSDIEYIEAKSPSINYTFQDSAVTPRTVSDALDQLCPAFSGTNSCRMQSSVYPGFVRRIYTLEMTIPQRSSDLVFSWTNGSRNAGILNLTNASQYNIYVACGINNLAKYNNSSPQYTVSPIPYLCVNQPVHFYNYPVDADNDSMVTFNKWPATGVFTQVNYALGYWPTNPIASPIGYFVDSVTGKTDFISTAVGKYAVAFQTNEYNRATGQQMGFIMRDVQISILPCNAAPPVFQNDPLNMVGGVLGSSNEISVNAGTALAFDIKANTPAGTDIAGFVQSSLPAGANVQITKASIDSVNFHFTWTPSNNDTGNLQIIYKAADTSCNVIQPVNLSAYHAVNIRVNRTLGVSSFNNYSKIKLHPVPAHDVLYFEKNVSLAELVEVFDMTGRKVLVIKYPGASINVANLVPGYYSLKMIGKEGVLSGTFIKN